MKSEKKKKSFFYFFHLSREGGLERSNLFERGGKEKVLLTT